MTCGYLDIFDCSAAENKVKNNYVEITNLPIDAILGNLFAKEVITKREKETIEAIPLKSNKMEYFLDSVINPSLSNKVSIKFIGFMKVMEESGDPIFIDMAKKLGTDM